MEVAICTINYREWFGTAASYPCCGDFHNKGSPLSEDQYTILCYLAIAGEQHWRSGSSD